MEKKAILLMLHNCW